jgi:glycosyltransferase involved in cell wall biosynthesis
MAGPAIRVWELAHALARQQPVTIGTPNESDVTSTEVAVRCYQGRAMDELVETHEIVVGFGYLLRQFPVIPKRAHYLVMDIFGPFILENLHMHDELPLGGRMRVHQGDLDVVLEALERADYMICASERQRDFWLGALTAANRINPYNFEADRAFRRLIDVVPFGLPDQPPQPSGHAIRTTEHGIDADDVVVLWSGGIWNWFDPLTLIRAIDRIKSERPAVKAYFMGVRHPDPAMPQMAMAAEAFRLAEQLGLRDRRVFFSDGWIPYGQRVNYLCDADLAISLHHEHIETRISFRTRVLDYLWAGLPLVSTAGDTLTDSITAAAAGVSVPEGDVEALATALLGLARDPARRAAMRSRSAALAKNFTWQKVAAPLLRYCAQPYRAADAGKAGIIQPRIRRSPPQRAAEIWKEEGGPALARRVLRRTPGMGLLARSYRTWQVSGLGGVARKARRKLLRRRFTR